MSAISWLREQSDQLQELADELVEAGTRQSEVREVLLTFAEGGIDALNKGHEGDPGWSQMDHRELETRQQEAGARIVLATIRLILALAFNRRSRMARLRGRTLRHLRLQVETRRASIPPRRTAQVQLSSAAEAKQRIQSTRHTPVQPPEDAPTRIARTPVIVDVGGDS